MNHIHRHFKKIILLSLLIPTVTFAAAFESYQVGSSPSNGYLLQTNGSVSTWVATSTLSDINYWLRSGSNLYYSSGNVGIGTTSPSAKLSVTGTSGSTANIFAIASSTNARLLTVTSAGNVGIGTTSPLSVLEVSGSPDILRLSGVSNPQLRFLTNSSNSSARSVFMAINQATLGDFVIRQSASNSSDPSTGTTRFQITPSGDISLNQSSGNVGIGTTSPSAKLQITQTSTNDNETLSLQNYAGWTSGKFNQITWRDNVNVAGALGMTYNSTTGTVDFAVNSLYNSGYKTTTSVPFIVKGSGNVGIGTTSPAALLSVMNTAGGTTPLFTIASSTSGLGTTTAFMVAANGSVGVGSSTPNATLAIHSVSTQSGTTQLFTIASSTNSQVFTVLGNEKVGIGTNNPQGTLSVRTGGTVAGGTIYFDNFTCGAGYAGFSFNGDVPTSCGVYNFLSGSGDKSLYINRPTGNDILFRENNGTAQVIIKRTTGNTGIGTTSPSAKLDIYGSAGTADMFNVSSSTNTSVFKVDSKGHIVTGGSSPTISTGLISGNDNAGRFTIPTSVTTATITFAQSWVTTPSCIVNQETGAFLSTEASSTPTTFVITNGITIASTTFSYQCIGF